MHLLRNIWKINPAQRSIFGALNIIFNRVNQKRIKEVGPDRACAEWLMRNGAFVRWRGQESFVTSYNLLPLDPEETGQFNIEEVTAREASISHHGFEHFYGCQCVTTMSFDSCWYLDNACLKKLNILVDSLLCLEIKKCHEVTDDGLLHLCSLKNLQILKLCDLDGVKNLENCIVQINTSLPNCQINPPTEAK